MTKDGEGKEHGIVVWGGGHGIVVWGGGHGGSGLGRRSWDSGLGRRSWYSGLGSSHSLILHHFTLFSLPPLSFGGAVSMELLLCS